MGVEGKGAVGDREVFAVAWRELGLAGEPPEIDPVYADGGFRSPWAGEYPRARVVVDRDGSLHVERETLAAAPEDLVAGLGDLTLARARRLFEGLGLQLRIEPRGERGYAATLLTSSIFAAWGDRNPTGVFVVAGPAEAGDFLGALRAVLAVGIRRARDDEGRRL